MSVRVLKRLFDGRGIDTAGFSFCAGFFLFGALAGAVSANYISLDDGAILKDYLLTADSSLFETGAFLHSLFNAFIFHFIAVFLGFSALGFLLLPLLLGIRGFFLTFVAAAVIRALGVGGLLVALVLFGLPSLISVPCLFILSVQSFASSVALTGALLKRSLAPRLIYGSEYFNRCLFCAAALIISAVVDAYLAPILASLAAGFL